ncbi:hypothetical protein CEUSTIGMA_g8760.t1 [Chlamydomonas eustigma]|uniref:Beta-Casp domain-containing protein n=1 Tax=Chlamydomonas eustigma TaxID=1157962 RepID=A0A250XEI5_9CHLO|nr:hypothetical protein CEUSTIGMA_g8760.t1 [Chlamydomonas eustigma]|eukprot:GAX81329.1 hypothetical protein CEUSTIGMA_g8760.t1 [Chlamydomonas eustigma]
MELLPLGQGMAPCVFLQYRNTGILLDCAMDIRMRCSAPIQAGQPGQAFILGPSFQHVKLLDIHAVLVSSPEGLLGLPYLMRLHRRFCTWRIYSTLAALEVARHLAAELQDVNTRIMNTVVMQPSGMPKGGNTKAGSEEDQLSMPTAETMGWSVDSDVQEGHEKAYQSCWSKGYYSNQDLLECLSRVEAVRYGQFVSIDGMNLQAVAYPSGGGMGHALWVISDETHRIGYASSLAPGPNLSLDLEPGTMSGLSALVLGSPALQGCRPDPNPSAFSTPDLKMACDMILETLKKGGNALVAVPATGAAWVLIEALAATQGLLNSEAGSSRLIAYVGPAARDSLALASTCVDFLNRCSSRDSLALASTCVDFLNRRRQGQLLHAESPFPFDNLLSSGHLVTASSLADPRLLAAWREPCVVLVSQCSLSAGPGQQLLRKWGADVLNLLLIDQSHRDCTVSAVPEDLLLLSELGPFMGRRSHGGGCTAAPGIRVQQCHVLPAPPSLSHMAELIGRACPRHLILQQKDSFEFEAHGVRSSSITNCSWLQEVSIAMLTHPVSLPTSQVPSSAINNLSWREHLRHADGQEVLTAHFEGALVLQNDTWQLEVMSDASQVSFPEGLSKEVLCWGAPTITGILGELQDQGMCWVDVRMMKQRSSTSSVNAANAIDDARAVQEEDIIIFQISSPKATIKLGKQWADIHSDSLQVCQTLRTCVARQLQSFT